MQQVIRKSDPAPSRLAYRMQRMMLTPLVRGMLRVGLPFTLALGGASIYLSDDARVDEIRLAITDIRHQIESRPEFMVKLMVVDGASPEIAEDIREIVSIDFPISSFDLSLEEIRETIMELPAVADASVRIKPGGVLQVDLKERVPVVLWRSAQGLALLDAEGNYVGEAGERQEHKDLPVIAGAGADRTVKEALQILRAAGPLADRMRGLVRMGDRRWDVVLDRGQRVLLPADNPVQALERVLMLNQSQDMMARDLAHVDMRIASRPTIRMNPDAVQQWWRIKKISAGD
ncbi:cell division protein FtsQ/DivIB [Thalassovita sp.]|uniref:cell division protein FtsQ/DivIB n=1 Tax=Thalassovita sp. TaxID=1979401 RepID=UPI0029DE7AF1|nr:cell division protein FtsQ/DivIB [Thalassovita sp.]